MELYASLWILLRLATLAQFPIPATVAVPVTPAFFATSATPATPGMIATPVTPAMLTAIADRDAALPGPEYIMRNIWVQPLLREAVDDALTASATFREQVAYLGSKRRAQIAITVDPDPSKYVTSRAHCEMRLYSSGVLIALVTLPGPKDAPELVAHELEHIIERLEGVNLKMESTRRTPGVWQMPDGRLESQRALDAGRQVKLEVAKARVLLTSR